MDDRTTGPVADGDTRPEPDPVADGDTRPEPDPVADGDARPEPGIATRAKAGVGWLTGQIWLAKAGGFVTLIILARLLTPSEFGIVAVAMTILPLVYLLADLGFGTYLLQTKVLDRVTTSTAFWYSVSCGVVLSGALAIASPLLEWLFDTEGVGMVVIGLTPAIIIVSIAAVPIALMRRNMQYRQLALQSAAASLLGQIAAIVLAFAGAGVWALVVQAVIVQAVLLIGAWISSHWRPAWAFNWGIFGEMARFGGNVVGVNAVGMVRNWTENAIITNVLGAAALGRLTIAQRLVQTTQDVAQSALGQISTVVFAQVRDDPERLRRGYLRALGLTYFAVAPALTGILVLSPVLVPLLFGDQWQSSAPASQALAVAAVFVIGGMLDHGLMYGLGRPGVWLAYATAVEALTVLATAIAVSSGIVWIAIGFAIVAAVAAIARWVLVSRAISAHLWTVARPLVMTVILMALAAAAGWGMLVLVDALPGVVQVIVVGFVIVLVYLAASRMLVKAAFHEAFERVLRRVRRGRA